MTDKKERIILSGMRPTGTLHIGNYFGALLPLVKMQETADTLFIMIADLHALTTLEHSDDLKQSSISLAMAYVASGIDPKKSTIFIQSRIPEHAELANIFSMITPVSMLELNPTYKEMRKDHPAQNNLGLLAYPVLQAADILLYKATEVPVGKDQAPHIEMTREIARRFNAKFGDIFPEPKTVLQKESKIFSLQDPLKKMSKSHGEKTYIGLLDTPDEIRQKIKTAVTDSEACVIFNPTQKPAVSNLLTIYSLFSGSTIKELEKQYQGTGYADFKKDLAEVIIQGLNPLQKKYKELEQNPSHTMSILRDGSKKARITASETMEAVRKTIGFA